MTTIEKQAMPSTDPFSCWESLNERIEREQRDASVAEVAANGGWHKVNCVVCEQVVAEIPRSPLQATLWCRGCAKLQRNYELSQQKNI